MDGQNSVAGIVLVGKEGSGLELIELSGELPLYLGEFLEKRGILAGQFRHLLGVSDFLLQLVDVLNPLFFQGNFLENRLGAWLIRPEILLRCLVFELLNFPDPLRQVKETPSAGLISRLNHLSKLSGSNSPPKSQLTNGLLYMLFICSCQLIQTSHAQNRPPLIQAEQDATCLV